DGFRRSARPHLPCGAQRGRSAGIRFARSIVLSSGRKPQRLPCPGRHRGLSTHALAGEGGAYDDATGDVPMLTLYYGPHPCALASHIALEEAGATYETVRLSFKTDDQKKPDYLKI